MSRASTVPIIRSYQLYTWQLVCFMQVMCLPPRRVRLEPDKMHQVPKILFCHKTLHVSGIYCAHHQELSAVHAAIDMFHAGYVAAA
jgi:hypothetical protein